MTRVCVIGPGRVGTALALALPAGYEVVGVVGRGATTLGAFQRAVPSARPMDLRQAGNEVDLVLVCVPDDQLEAVAREAGRRGAVRADGRWVHTAGGAGPEALRPVRLAGARTAACHPAQTFPDARTGAAALAGTAWAVTTPEEDAGWAETLVRDLEGVPVRVPPGARVLYHSALVLGANATSALVTLARELLLAAGVADPSSFLVPLAATSVRNAAEGGAQALTGPVRRGDAGTVSRHLSELGSLMPEAVPVYVETAALALRYARRAGLAPEAARALIEVLEEGGARWTS